MTGVALTPVGTGGLGLMRTGGDAVDAEDVPVPLEADTLNVYCNVLVNPVTVILVVVPVTAGRLPDELEGVTI